MQFEKEKILINRNIKPTAMRQLVLDVLSKQKAAISLPELEDMFEKADKATLYRTLKTFEENKLIHHIDDGSGAVKYALCQESCECEPEDLHVHFYCTVCQKTFCLNDTPVPSINLPKDFSLEKVNMVVSGICASCQK
ncbi:Fur family transcriptional regulator [Anaerophaga thermohalophila]|jgi:Fur family ferric uptake transcriptional regulator|uniref:Fur family transcriptional regulator n=1 Tax=Anaerophaga thermohalophila TaxID=177400 RepID=UPI0002EB9B07|nr:transcriptional repressor [Anaerophaga thermohalophila]